MPLHDAQDVQLDSVVLAVRDRRLLIDKQDWPTVRALSLHIGTTGYAYYSKPRCGRKGAHTATLHSLLIGTKPGFHADHINGDKLDNRRANLRLVPIMLNHANRHILNRNNTTGVRGVVHVPATSRANPWRAQIGVDGRGISLGYFATREQAVDARRAAELHYFGELCPVPNA